MFAMIMFDVVYLGWLQADWFEMWFVIMMCVLKIGMQKSNVALLEVFFIKGSFTVQLGAGY